MISMKLQGLDKAIRDLQSWETEKIKKVADQINRSAIRVESDAKRNVPTDKSGLKTDIQAKTDRTQNNRIVSSNVFNTKHYAPYVEFGTKGKVSVPPELKKYAMQFQKSGGGGFDLLLEDIAVWARRKGIPEEAVYPIARKIAREGVDAQPYLFPAFEKERPLLIQKLKDILR